MSAGPLFLCAAALCFVPHLNRIGFPILSRSLISFELTIHHVTNTKSDLVFQGT